MRAERSGEHGEHGGNVADGCRLRARLGIVAWTAGALYFDVGRAKWFARPLVLMWIAAVFAGFVFWQPMWKPLLALLGGSAVFLFWWFSQKPWNDRDWNLNFAVLPCFELEGDVVTVHQVRNTEYRTLVDFTPHYEERAYHHSRLEGVDAVITYWGSPWLCHPMLIFDFGKEGRLCILIEVRYRVGQKYGFWRSLYRQQEIMYVVSDERDAILKRAKHAENHDVYLYRMQVDAEEIRKVLLEYVVGANYLVANPRWYHGLTTNCTTSVYRQRSHEIDWDWRWLFNGKLDGMLYDHGRLDNRLPFTELKNQSKVNEIVERAPVEGFGDFIRLQLPGYQ